LQGISFFWQPKQQNTTIKIKENILFFIVIG
jgi:hypothetical protein